MGRRFDSRESWRRPALARIFGNYTQGSGGQLNMRLANGGVSDSLSVSGTATLGGTLDLSGAVTPNQQWTVIFTGNGISEDFDTLNFPDGNPNWRRPAPLDPNNYIVAN